MYNQTDMIRSFYQQTQALLLSYTEEVQVRSSEL